MTAQYTRTNHDVLINKLVEYLSSKVPGFSSQEHLNSSFSSLGLDSISHVEMTAIIADHLQESIDPALAFDYPTINSLANYLQQNYTNISEFQENA